MSWPGEVEGDKVRAIVALIERIDETVGSGSSSKEKRKTISKPSVRPSRSRSSAICKQ